MRQCYCLIVSAILMLGCEVRTEQVGTQQQLDETSATSFGVSNTVDTVASSTEKAALECLGVHEQACNGGCVDITTDPLNCSCCGCACGADERCHQAECESNVACEKRAITFDAATLLVDEVAQDAGRPPNESVVLYPGQAVDLAHAFQSGPATIVLLARAGAPRAGLGLEIAADSGFVSRIPIRSSQRATYRVELTGDGVSTLTIGATVLDEGGALGSLLIERVEIHECDELHRVCPQGGVYLVEESACVPLVCDTAEDCGEHFQRGGFAGECRDGKCAYPSCDAETQLRDVRCFGSRELSDPLRNPSSPTAIHVDDFSECPDITALRWIFEPFRGEGSCVSWPVCGPNPPELFGYEPQAGECCYVIGELCGV